MKRILSIILLFCGVILTAHCQNLQKYLVFTFNCSYKIGKYMHGTGDNVWIVPYDSCKKELPENLMMPLFAEDALIRCVNDSIENAQSFGYFPTTDYLCNLNVKKLLKHRKTIQSRTVNFPFDKSKEVLNIYFVPIIAKCDM